MRHRPLGQILRWLVPCALLLVQLMLLPAVATAAEVLQVRGPTLLQVGDGNRSYSVELACIQVEEADAAAAVTWLRQELPRRARVNLRPLGQHDGTLLARVEKLGTDRSVGDGLVHEGLAAALPLEGCG